ncbi:hypothetical protein ACVWXL_000547 [Bradyrhizobium sp. GM22.5]
MLIHPTVDRLRALGLAAMADTLTELQNNPEATGMPHALACALGNKACRDSFSVLYKRASRLFADLAQARGEGRLARLIVTGMRPPPRHRAVRLGYSLA